jgi:hydroxypyruvate reductase
MKNVDILCIGPIYAPSLAKLEDEFTVHKLWLSKDKPATIAELAGRIRGVASFGPYGVDAKLIDALPKLEIISNFGVGYDAIDIPAAKRRGIIVTNTPNVLNDCVADLAMGLTIDALRRVSQGDRFVRSGGWLKGNLPFAQKVGGRTMGILGYGRVGKAIAKRAEAFGMTIVYHGRRQQANVAYKYYPNLVDMARDADVLMVICEGGAATRHLVNAGVMAALGPDGTLVNVARGSVVDEEALVDALRQGKLGAAALDVYQDEPRVPEALFAMDNVVLQPHRGSATHETRGAMGDLTVENLRLHFAGKQVLTPVT